MLRVFELIEEDIEIELERIEARIKENADNARRERVNSNTGRSAA